MRSNSQVVTILTDFQVGNFYTAQMKGVLLSRAPEVKIVDVTDAVLPQNILHGALILAQTAPFFPKKTIHIAVVDPQVGSERELLCVVLNEKFGFQRILCPNNGLPTFLLETNAVSETFLLQSPVCFLDTVSSTFHGRDILAPTAAFLANGGEPRELGPRKDPNALLRLNFPKPEIARENNCVKIIGEILYADSFGNLVTNVSRNDWLPLPQSSGQTFTAVARLDGISFSFVQTYADLPSGTPAALFGSQNLLELALVNGNLKQSGKFPPGTRFTLEIRR